MDDHRIEEALRAGPPDQAPHRQGALARGLAARGEPAPAESTFRVTLRPERSRTAPLLVAAAAALVILWVAVGGPASRPQPTASVATASIGTSSPPASSGPSASSTTAAGRGAPVALVDRWTGAIRAIPGLPRPASRTVLDIMGAGFRVDAGNGEPNDLFASSVTQASPDTLRLTAATPTKGCEAFDEGTYRWSLSPAGTTLTLTLVRDACAARAATLPGSWTHTACREAARDCLGPLEAGTYQSTEFDPFRTGSAGQVSYRVPDGWANSVDHPTNYYLRPTPDYLADPASDGNDTLGGVYLWAGTLAAAQPADCAAVPAPGVAATADAIAAYVAHLSGLAVVDRGTTSVAGRTGRVLDVSLAAYPSGCPWSGGDPFRSLIMFADLGSGGGVWGMAPGERARIVFVDVAPGRVVSIWIDAPEDRIDGLLPDAMTIVGSLDFIDRPAAP